jgi:hypothetical protein
MKITITNASITTPMTMTVLAGIGIDPLVPFAGPEAEGDGGILVLVGEDDEVAAAEGEGLDVVVLVAAH